MGADSDLIKGLFKNDALMEKLAALGGAPAPVTEALSTEQQVIIKEANDQILADVKELREQGHPVDLEKLSDDDAHRLLQGAIKKVLLKKAGVAPVGGAPTDEQKVAAAMEKLAFTQVIGVALGDFMFNADLQKAAEAQNAAQTEVVELTGALKPYVDRGGFLGKTAGLVAADLQKIADPLTSGGGLGVDERMVAGGADSALMQKLRELFRQGRVGMGEMGRSVARAAPAVLSHPATLLAGGAVGGAGLTALLSKIIGGAAKPSTGQLLARYGIPAGAGLAGGAGLAALLGGSNK